VKNRPPYSLESVDVGDAQPPLVAQQLEEPQRIGFMRSRTIGRCVCDESGQALGAITIAIPSARFSRDKIRPLARELALTTERAAPDLARLPER
jgi:hypothetical protein